MLNSSSNESTVGLEADMLLGERSIGLESPFIPPEETRFSTVIDISIIVVAQFSSNSNLAYLIETDVNERHENRMLTSFLIVSIVTSVAQILQQRVQLRQIVVEGRHLPSAAAFRDALLDGLAVLISRL